MRRVTSAADLAVACPLCHAQPGRPCGWKGAVYPDVVHRERKREARLCICGHSAEVHSNGCRGPSCLSAPLAVCLGFTPEASRGV